MSEKILNIYQSILAYSGLGVDEDGRIFEELSLYGDDKKPVYAEVDGEPLVFPVKAQFNQPDQKKFYFHPFSESFVRGESEIIQFLRERIAIRINFVTAVVAQKLLELLASPGHHKNLTESQAELLIAVGDADTKSAANWGQLMIRAIKASRDGAFVKLYLKHSGTLRGESYARIGVVSFPFYQNLISDKLEVARQKDKPTFKKLLEFIFSEIQTAEAYNFGTRSRDAPYLEALMMASALVAARLNYVVSTFANYIPDAGKMLFNMDWSDHFDDLGPLRTEIRSMPELRGNAGSVAVSEKNHPVQRPVEAPPVPAAPVAAPVPVQQTTPVLPYAPMQAYPQAGVQQPVQVPAPVIPAVQANRDGKINFGDVLRTNPVLAMQANPLAPQQLANPYARPMQAPPSWAMPAQPVGYPPMQIPMQQPMMPGHMVMQQPMQQPMVQQPMQQPQLPMPPAGYQYATNQFGQIVTVPIQPMPVPMQQPMPGNPPPPGWGYR